MLISAQVAPTWSVFVPSSADPAKKPISPHFQAAHPATSNAEMPSSEELFLINAMLPFSL